MSDGGTTPAEVARRPLRPLIRSAHRVLDDAGVPSPGHDARALARLALARTDGGMLELVDDVSVEFAREFAALVARRRTREPLQIIEGVAHFHRVILETAPGVFIPRPETESVVEAVLGHARRSGPGDSGGRRPEGTQGAEPRDRGGDGGAGPVIVDLCAGTGAIAIAVAAAMPLARVWAVELDSAAVALARRNVDANGVRVVVVEGDAASELSELDGTVDVVASNPPYIPPDGVPRDPEVHRWDPPAALYGGGDDGLDTPRAVVASAARLLKPGGTFVMEHADEQGLAVRGLVASHGAFTMIETHQDLAGRDRFVVARRATAHDGRE
ncbi:MAG TPA: peptide chain release factor N(5)-glutamine methyltransferase [Actinomycetaceae bacterium]|nr:peptide chain release factor N(5)-glutamine methyltransferase [Actinomycetaceae bacterium]